GVGALVDDEVDAEVLHGGIEELLDDGAEAVDLVDEEDIAAIEIGEDAHQVTGTFQGGTGGGDNLGAHLGGDNMGEGGLTEAGRTVEDGVFEGLAAGARGLN